ncbi:hypothetical protein VA596_25465 [Amycolatopsis sp., V23-08]|uniref:Uncharacterized protein n=1 Tax=Amycolatopsis heterodermiae TaxID=3110235 RepID=A0ABU5R9J1_9PSEU|nr:hypothetical protein [Amycolatopsis sp., V23-08]MEA5362907.1 hypothetical protein [Amycolatopsis sp., V23-08]
MNKKADVIHLIDQLHDALYGMRITIEQYSRHDYTPLGILAPELASAIQNFKDFVILADRFFQGRMAELSREEEAPDLLPVGHELRSKLPLPGGKGSQLNLEAPVTRQANVSEINRSEFPDQSISVAVYLDTDDEELIRRVLKNVDNLVGDMGYGPPEDVETIRGSIFRRSWSRVKGFLKSDEVAELREKAGRALEIQGLMIPEADVTFKLSQSASQLIASVADVPSACLRLGSILLIKYTLDTSGPVLLVRNLSTSEILALERYPEIQKNPSMALEMLATAIETSSTMDSPEGDAEENEQDFEALD